MTLTALFSALMCVCAWIAVPTPSGVSFTLQTFAFILAGLVLKPFEAFCSSAVYLLLGIAGLPVFQNFTTLYSKLGTPSGGYIIGFVFAAVLISLARNAVDPVIKRFSLPKACKHAFYIVIAIVLGILIIDIPGVVQLELVTGMDIRSAVITGAVMFLPTDILKCVLAAVTALALEKPLKKTERSA